jgi:hypothetical protein
MAANGKAKKKPGGVTGRGFMPGKSGNPGGRVREVADLRVLARQATPTIINNLVHVVEHGRWPNERAKVADTVRMVAHLTLLDRGYGKPVQANLVADLTPLPAPKTITGEMTVEQAAQAYAETIHSMQLEQDGVGRLLEPPAIIDVPPEEGES